MIRINKPQHAPDILTTKGRAARRAICARYTRHSQDYDTGVKTFEFDREIYGHETVKSALILLQHDKCCFCESKITHISYGDVEHFRPKAGYRQRKRDRLGRPGYYWLAYEWTNLFLSCEMCNRRFKGNLFPLLNQSNRATSHKDGIERENPRFINPSEENPEEFISFREGVPYPINNVRRGKDTIKMLGLDRNELNERRREYYEQLRLIFSLAFADPPQPTSDAARMFLEKSVLDSSEYAAMARVAIASQFSTDV